MIASRHQGLCKVGGESDGGEGGARLGGEAATGGSDRGSAEAMDQADGGIAEGGYDLRRVVRPDRCAVLIERDIADIMQPIFDGPVAAPERQQLGRGGARRRSEVTA